MTKASKEINMLLSAGKIVKIVSFGKGKDAYSILFEDGKTILELESQDYFTYHDCDTHARIMHVFQDEDTWERRMSDPYFKEAKNIV